MHALREIQPCPPLADGSITESKLSIVGLDGYPLAPLLPKPWLEQPAASFSTDEWEVRPYTA